MCRGIPRPPSRVGKAIRDRLGSLGTSLGDLATIARIASFIRESASPQRSSRPIGHSCRCKCLRRSCILPLRRSRLCCLGRSRRAVRALSRVASFPAKKALLPAIGPIKVPNAGRPCSCRSSRDYSLLFVGLSCTGEPCKTSLAACKAPVGALLRM